MLINGKTIGVSQILIGEHNFATYSFSGLRETAAGLKV